MFKGHLARPTLCPTLWLHAGPAKVAYQPSSMRHAELTRRARGTPTEHGGAIALKNLVTNSTDDMRIESPGCVVEVVQLPENAFLREASLDLARVRVYIDRHGNDRTKPTAKMIAAMSQ